LTSIIDIIGDVEDDKFHDVNDIMIYQHEWQWHEVGVSCVSVLTGELKYIKDLEKRIYKDKNK